MSQKLLKKLKEVRRVAAMETCSFDNPCEPDFMTIARRTIENPQPVTSFIRERTRLYRESWLISPLDEMIADMERQVSSAKKRERGRR